MKNNNQHVHRDWNAVVASVKAAAAELICARRPVNGVYGVPADGICVAMLFSRILKVELLESPRLGCLVVAGEWIPQAAKTFYSKYHPIYYADAVKVGDKAPPEFYGMQVPAEAKVTFPWDVSL